jgi:hypothetical protein
VGIFNWYYLSSPPQILRCPVVHLESRITATDLASNPLIINSAEQFRGEPAVCEAAMAEQRPVPMEATVDFF